MTSSGGVTATNPEETANSLFHRALPTAGLPYLQSARLENPIGVNGLSKTLIKKVRWGGVGWSGVEWSGVEWSGVEWSRVE